MPFENLLRRSSRKSNPQPQQQTRPRMEPRSAGGMLPRRPPSSSSSSPSPLSSQPQGQGSLANIPAYAPEQTAPGSPQQRPSTTPPGSLSPQRRDSLSSLTSSTFEEGIKKQNHNRNSQDIPPDEVRYAYHVTPSENVDSIKETGLQPSYGGGERGFSSGIPQFENNSKNQIHATPSTTQRDKYKNNNDDRQILRVRIPKTNSVERDPDAEGSIRTKDPIPNKQILFPRRNSQDSEHSQYSA
jgi:hypothetical protein